MVETRPFVYSRRQFVSNAVKSTVIVVIALHAVHLVERHCGSRHAAQKHLVTGEISSTDLLSKLRRRDVVDLHITPFLFGDSIFGVEVIEGVCMTPAVCGRS